MAVIAFNIDDGTKRQMWQNPTSLGFFSYPVAPNWPIPPGGNINQTLIADGSSTTSLPLFLFQGLRMYDSPVAWVPKFAYKEQPYVYAVPINFVANTVNPPAIIQQTIIQIVNNYAFKLRRISLAYHRGPTNTTGVAQQLGCRFYDWQNRSLMSDWVNTMFLNFNAPSQTGVTIYGPHSSFPPCGLFYPVNGQIKIDLTDMLAQAAGAVSDVQGMILFDGVNLVPCDPNAPNAIAPNDGAIQLYDGRVVYPLPYFYTPPMVNITSNEATFTSQQPFTVATDGDSEFWLSVVHNANPPTSGGPV